MAPLPKRKYAKARQGKRRSHLRLDPVQLVACPHCHSPKLPHRVCLSCGYYAGKEVISVKKKKKS